MKKQKSVYEKEKRRYLTIPNVLTILRIIAVPFICYFLYKEKVWTAALLFFFAAILDFFDGRLARKYNQITKFGTILDPIADKILVISCLALLAIKYGIFWWIAGIIILREVAISLFRVLVFNTVNERAVSVDRLGKWKAAFQFAGIIYVILALPYANLIMAMIAALTVISGAYYLKRLIVSAKQNKKI